MTVGASEALYLALSAIFDPGDEVIVPEPCFVAYVAGGVLRRRNRGDGSHVRGEQFPGDGGGNRTSDHPEDQGHPDRISQQPHRRGDVARKPDPRWAKWPKRTTC